MLASECMVAAGSAEGVREPAVATNASKITPRTDTIAGLLIHEGIGRVFMTGILVCDFPNRPRAQLPQKQIMLSAYSYFVSIPPK